jgi:O-antigen/teichoic acid export membrane protein
MVDFFRNTIQGVGTASWRPIIKAGGIGTLNRAATIGIRLVTVPLLLNYFGTERFGLVMTIVSIAGYVMLLDLGLASALVNKLTHAYAAGDKSAANLHFTAGFAVLGVISIAMGFPTLVLVKFIDWVSLFKLSVVHNLEAEHVVSIALLFFFTQLPLSIVLKVPYAFQRGVLTESYIFLGNVVGLIGIIVGVHFTWPEVMVVVFMIGGPTIASLALLCHLFIAGELSFDERFIKGWRGLVVEIRRSGYDFFVMQAVGMMLNTLQFMMLAFYHGAETVAIFSVLSQVSLGIQTPFIALVQPMWTKVAELSLKGKRGHIRSMLSVYFWVAGGYSVLASAFMLFLLDPVLSLILKSPLPIGIELKIGFAALTTLGLLFGGGLGAVILGMNLTRQMALIVVAQFVVFILISFLLVPPLATVGTLLAVCSSYVVAVPGILYLLRKNLRDVQ